MNILNVSNTRISIFVKRVMALYFLGSVHFISMGAEITEEAGFSDEVIGFLLHKKCEKVNFQIVV